MGDWNRSLLLVVLWSWRSRTLWELKVQNCWFIYLLCEQEANKLREIQKIQVIARVCERLCYVSKRNSSDGVHGMARSRMSSFGGGHGVVVSGIGDHPNRLKTQPRHAYDMRRLAFWLLAMHPRLFNLYSTRAEYRSYLQTNSSLIFLKKFRFKRQYLSVSEFNPPLTATWRPLWGQMAPQSRHKETRIDLLRLMNECLMIASKNWIASVIKRSLGFLSEFAWQCQCRPSISLSSPQAPITFRFCPIFQLANTHIIGTPAAARQKWSTKLQMLSYSIPRIITNIALPAGNQASINNKQKITAYKLLWLP